MTEVIKEVICVGSANCPCWPCETPPIPPESGCDMECLGVGFGGTRSQTVSIGDPPLGSVDLSSTLSPGDGGQICDQATLTGELVLSPNGRITMSWEVVDSLDASNAIWTLVSNTHINGDSGAGSATLTVTFVWRYNADGVTEADIDVSCCLTTLPQIGVEWTVGGTTHTYYLTSGHLNGGTMSLCGTEV